MELISTKDVTGDGVKILVYGTAGIGKTRMISTTGNLERTLIISAEAGLLSLKGFDIPAIEVHSLDDVRKIYNVLASKGNERYDWVCLDSISEIAENELARTTALDPDPRKSYPAMQSRVLELIKDFRDLKSINVYFSCKAEKVLLEKSFFFKPSMPGNKLGDQLPFLFNEVLFMTEVLNQDTGKDEPMLQTFKNSLSDSKDRSGTLDKYEQPNLAAIAAKISSKTEGEN